MTVLRKLRKGAKVVWTFAYSLTELVLTRPQSRRSRAEWLSRFCRRVLRAADVTWVTRGPVPDHGAVITNHLSYLDILVHAAMRPCVFVSAIETRRMPLIGWISMMAGTVYVVRGAGGSAAQAAGGMAEGFRDGLPVVFFPEGGTGVGDVPLLPLHSGLLANALADRAPVTPGFLRYGLSPEDMAAGRSPRNDVAWGDQTLPAHLWNLLGLRRIQAKARFAAQPVPFTPEAYADRKVAADQARAALLDLAGTSQENSPTALLK
jgi:lyso-ornithine lipid O-acyltransferase